MPRHIRPMARTGKKQRLSLTPIPAPARIPGPTPIPEPAPIPKPTPIQEPARIPEPAPIPEPAWIPEPAPIPEPTPIKETQSPAKRGRPRVKVTDGEETKSAAKRGRPALGIDKKQRINLTLSGEARHIADWLSRETHTSTSQIFENLILEEAKRVSKKTGKQIPQA